MPQTTYRSTPWMQGSPERSGCTLTKAKLGPVPGGWMRGARGPGLPGWLGGWRVRPQCRKVQETWVPSSGQEDPLEEGMARRLLGGPCDPEEVLCSPQHEGRLLTGKDFGVLGASQC